MSALNLTRQFAGFIVVGAANAAITYVIYLLLQSILGYVAAYSIAFGAGIVISATMNGRLVFGVALSLGGLIAYAAFYLASYGVGVVLLTLLVELAGMSEIYAPVLVAVLLIPVNFLGARFILGHKSSP